MSATDLLLDTHTFLWWDEGKLPRAVVRRIQRGGSVWVSAVSAWEIAIKSRLGRLNGEPLLSAWSDVLDDMTATELAIDAGDAILAGRLPWEHKDPFDRVLVAQATRRNLTLATSDADILRAALTPILKI